MIDAKQLGPRIAQRRKRLGMTQKQLSAMLSVSPQAVSKWERCVSLPDLVFLDELAGALAFSLDELLTGKTA